TSFETDRIQRKPFLPLLELTRPVTVFSRLSRLFNQGLLRGEGAMKLAAPCRLVALGLAVAAVACGRQSQVVQPTPTSQTFTILDGWAQSPVAGAAVTANGTQALTDSAGEVQFPASPSPCVIIDVKATGFLDRRTCGSSVASRITLWPVVSADEGEVTR